MKTQDFISIDLIDPNPYQPASAEDPAKVAEIAMSLDQNLASGIGTNGLLQVPTARQVNGRYQLAFGRHRHLAFIYLRTVESKEAFSKMPVIIEDLSDLQMFEAMAIENLQRREISFIEEAETYQTYMTTFNKNSVKTAARFQKSEEHIRGRIMFLQLSDAAKEQVKAGNLNVSAARSLVSLNKIGGSALVDKALQEIQKHPNEAPQEVVEDVLSSSQSATWLDKGASWFSANKNFPRKHLGKLTRAEVDQLLDIAGAAPEDIRLEFLRLMSEYPLLHTHLTPENYPAMSQYDPGFQRLKVVINPPPCGTCPFHTSVNNRDFCGIVMCRDRKVDAWEKKELEDISHKLGIPLYQKSDGRMIELRTWEPADKKLFSEGHADLRLAPASHMWNNFEGLGRDLKLVLIGALAEKRLKAQDNTVEKQQSKKANRELDLKIYNIKEQFEFRFGWEVASVVFVNALDGLSMPIVDFLLTDMLEFIVDDTQLPEGSDDHGELIELARKMKKADSLKQMRRVLMYDMLFIKALERLNTMGAKKNVIELAKDLQKVADEWGVKLPKDWMSQAEKYQVELDQALKELKSPKKVKS